MTRSSFRGVVPPLSDPDEARIYEETHAKVLAQVFFDKIMKKCNSTSIPVAFEPQLTEMFQAIRSIVWLNKDEISGFYSPTIDKTLNGSGSLVAASAIAKTVIHCPTIEDESAAEAIGCATGAPQLFFPLRLRGGDVVAVCHISREPGGSPFTEVEIEQARFLVYKFSIYGTCMLSPANTIFDACMLAQISDRREVIERLTRSLKTMFHCESVDFWIFREKTNTFARYESSENAFLVRLPTEIGIVAYALRARQFINERWRKYHVNYDDRYDGDGEAPILVGSEEVQEHVYAIALRGKTVGDEFTVDDDKKVQIVMPFVARSLAFSFGYLKKDVPRQVTNEFRMTQLLDGAVSITHVIDWASLPRKIEEDGKVIGGAEICRLWIVDTAIGGFVRRSTSNETRLQDGVIGEVYRTRESYATEDPNDDEMFDAEADLGDCDDARNVLAVPVFSAFDKVIAVLLLANKLNSGHFTPQDENQMSAYAVFCGVALQNAYTYHRIRGIPSLLKGIRNLPSNLSYGAVEKLLKELLVRARNLIRVLRCILFIEKNGELCEFVATGEVSENSTNECAKAAFSEKEVVLYAKKENEIVRIKPNEADGNSNVICCSPLFSSDKIVLGVLEFECGCLDMPEDIDVIQCFTRIAATTLEKAQLKSICEIGQMKLHSKQFFAPEELEKFAPPESFKVECNTFECDDATLMKAAFDVFGRFDLQSKFSIRNETLLSFLNQIAHRYRDLPHWNWRHAVDTCLFVANQLMELKTSIPSEEILVALAAALCHDVDPDGFQNMLDETATLPLSILYKKQSYYEARHCQIAMEIIGRDESNIFRHVSDSVRVWKDFVDLILATDMRKHFEFMDEFLSCTEFSFSNESVRQLAMKILLKVADISPCCRALDIAQTKKSVVAEEFFNTGDCKAVTGIVFDGSHINREASLVPFFNEVCLPLVNAASKLFPGLEDYKRQLEQNIEAWK